VFRDGTQVAQVIGTTHADTGLTNGTSYSYYVTAYDAAGNVSRPSNTVSATPSASSGGGTGYFATVPSSETGYPPSGYPQSDATCAAEVRPAAENRPDNMAANHTVPTNPSTISWSPDFAYWSKFTYDRNLVTGNYTGTTDEILQWAACKWGIDENIIRAAAATESRWHQSTVGDNCGIAGEASYGILQVRNKDCSGGWVHGGWPDTENETALDADYYAARLRACFDGAFYNGGAWLYGAQTIAQVIAAHGEAYALWGCVGSWYSGNWYDSGAQSYITSVQNYYTTKPWLSPGF
jgi:autotransporter family porin